MFAIYPRVPPPLCFPPSHIVIPHLRKMPSAIATRPNVLIRKPIGGSGWACVFVLMVDDATIAVSKQTAFRIGPQYIRNHPRGEWGHGSNVSISSECTIFINKCAPKRGLLWLLLAQILASGRLQRENVGKDDGGNSKLYKDNSNRHERMQQRNDRLRDFYGYGFH